MKVLFVVLSYLVGAIPAGYLLFKLSEKKDIRAYGSQSTGATNVLRLKGWKYAVPVAIFDVLKGFLPAFLASKLFGDPRLGWAASFLAVLGHCFPIYINFRGGKGVATMLGAFAAVAFRPFLLSAGLFILIILLTHYVSLGSMVAAISFPVWALLLHDMSGKAIWGVAIAFLIILKHSGNICRLLAGQERKLGERVS